MNNNFIGIGQLAVASAPASLIASGIGSCVVVCLYDKTKQIGGIAHIMLAKETFGNAISFIDFNQSSENQEPPAPAKFADTGIDNLIKELQNNGVDPKNLEAKIVGGSEMFQTITKSDQSIGTANINAVKTKLASLGIPIVSEDIGGNHGRSLIFFINSGQIEIKKRMQ